MCQPSLYFHIASRLTGSQEFLPACAALALSPDKQLAPLQAGSGGLAEAVAVFVQIRRELARRIRNLPEIINGDRISGRVRDVCPARYRNGIFAHDAALVVIGNRCIYDVPGAGVLPDSHIRPPVHGHCLTIRIDNAHPPQQDAGFFRQEEIHLVDTAPDAFKFIHPQNGCAVIQRSLRGKDLRAGERVVPDHAAIKLDAARQPRVAHGKIAGPHDRIAVKQLTPGNLVVQ